MSKIEKLAVETRLFDGFSRVLIFPGFDMTTLATATLAQVLANGKDCGQIVEGSESWDGDDVEVDTLKNTEGGAIRTKQTPGTCAWSCRIPHSAETAKIAGAKTHEVESLGDSFELGNGDVLGVNPKSMLYDCPVGVLNLGRSELSLFPNGSVAFTPTIEDDGLMEYSVNASANDIETENLSTMMFIPLAKDPIA